MNEQLKVTEFTYEDTLKQVKKETPEFLAEYIFKMNRTYNLLIDRVIELEEKLNEE